MKTSAAVVVNKMEEEEVDCGNFFDHIDDLLLDLPLDDLDTHLPPSNSTTSTNTKCFLNDSSYGSDLVLSHHNSNTTTSHLSPELSVPYEDIVQLEWLSNFVEDSFSGGNFTMSKLDEAFSINEAPSMLSPPFQLPSPISVLESSSSCSGSEKGTRPNSPNEIAAPIKSCGRARTKRPRPSTFSPPPMIATLASSENSAESCIMLKIPKRVLGSGENKSTKKQKVKPMVAVPVAEADQNAAPQQNARKCMHCEVTKTPQWRSGPMGPKTLCNACGVRYKSGRLFPEYRPAASPTFVPSLHSNSHKKVLEMRTKEPDNFTTNLPELIPNKNHPALEYM